ncbi:GH1 family beta-glucosidase [Luteipulveratus flavus]|uniref:Beta-glucosidase n=1 Tax=Luteipulveratus flavus TaxID=3031728 RepID=A0ABT6C6X1_9MICO|nr:GH1 family beta-glucosidase [Luteipulveratus sp. YIM 133296]MDF8264635.1 GH1 family beta-glucosidase [Luteipulveratus sp. YIM 133296]
MSEFPTLPNGFVLGTATASYQVEGAVDEDGRGRSVWDTFCAEPDRIKNGETGDVACDHYHRYPEDVALMSELGMDAYRFSIAWPRVVPDGSGPVNPAGLDFYDRLVDSLLAAEITPAATLFHWDLPQALQDAGGWQSRDTAARLAEYATVVGERLGDRVGMWMPINEPVVVTMFGHALGVHAPGLALGFDALPVAHHLLLGHGLAVQALRAAGCSSIGIASNHAPTWPASSSPEDQEAAALYDTLVNRLFADPVLTGAYPEGLAEAMPGPVEDDLKVISSPLDWFGINYYQPSLVGAPGGGGAESPVLEGAPVPEGLPFEPRQLTGYDRTDFGWAVVPDGLREILVTFRERYGDALPPVYVTESGCSFHDVVDEHGQVHDERRVAYHREHLDAVAAAVDAGVDVRGYFVWSLLDNFEWAEGFTERFGLVHVDFETQHRTPKDSYRWFQQHLATRPSGKS